MWKNFLSHLASNLHSVVSKMNQCIPVRLSYDFWLHYISVFRVAHHSRYCRKFILVHYRAAFYLSVSWWRHQMETFPRYWPFVRGIHRSPVNYPHKGHWRRARETGDLRRHRAHYDVIVMWNPPIPIRMLSQNITVCLIMTFIYADTVIMLKINMRRRDFRQHDWNSSRFFVILIIHSERTMEVMDEMHDDVIKFIIIFTCTLWGNPPVTGGFPSQRPVTRSFDNFPWGAPDKWLSKYSRWRWFETPWHSLWRHYNQVRRQSYIRVSVHFLIQDCLTKNLRSFPRHCLVVIIWKSLYRFIWWYT